MVRTETPQNTLVEFIETAMRPVDALLDKVKMADRQLVLTEAEVATCEAMGISQKTFDDRFNDPTRIKTVLPTLQAQTELCVRRHLSLAAQKEKMDQRIETYLQHPGLTAPFIYKPDREDVRTALSEAFYTLTVEDKIPEADLDGKARHLLHERITSYLFVQQLDKREFPAQTSLQKMLVPPVKPPADNTCGLV